MTGPRDTGPDRIARGSSWSTALQRRQRLAPVERRHALDGVVEQGAQAPDVGGAGRADLAPRLLGRHVRRRARAPCRCTVMRGSSFTVAMPKSASFTWPSGRTMTLRGLTSRWTMSAAWAALEGVDAPRHPWRRPARARGSPSGRRVGQRRGRDELHDEVAPVSPSSTTSNTRTEPGWSMRAAARASRSDAGPEHRPLRLAR